MVDGFDRGRDAGEETVDYPPSSQVKPVQKWVQLKTIH